MNEASGSSSRVIEVINFLAAHPTESFTLSELAVQLGLSHGSAHRTLKTLSEARYLSRHTKHKTYSLGTALVAIGHAALEKHRGIDIARREMARLAEELKAQCVAAAVVDGDILLLAREGVTQTYDGLSRVGERRPFVPPFGLVYVAWADADTVRTYLTRSPVRLDNRVRDHLRKALERIRQRGYAIAANDETLLALRKLTPGATDRQSGNVDWSRWHALIGGLSAKEIQLLSLADPGAKGISYISAPVFSPAGTVALELTLSGMPANLGAKEIEHYAERLRAAATVVTSETHGRIPQHKGTL